VRLFFSLCHEDAEYQCVLVWWYSTLGYEPCPDTGMWMVEPDFDVQGNRIMSVVHLDSILRGAHLLGIAGADPVPLSLNFTNSLDAFRAFYVNKYIDHHAHEIAF